MADSSQEKTEQPTSKRRDEARSKGQVAYSKELTGGILFALGLMAMKMAGDDIWAEMESFTKRMFQLEVSETLGDINPGYFLEGIMDTFLTRLMPIFLIALFGTLLAGFTQVGVRFAMKKLKPDFTRMNPITGLKKLFGLDNVAVVASSLMKITLVGIVVWVTVANGLPLLYAASPGSLANTLEIVTELIFVLGFRVAAGLLFIGFLDLLYRRWKHTKDLMMTKEDVREERKKSEGDPRVKGRIREIQRQMAIQRMKSDIKTADVVVRNPTHFAIGLKYQQGADAAPRVIAKGRGEMALTLIRIAEEAKVEVIENRPLARELYHTVKLGDFVPERLFKAVAEVLAFVYRKQRSTVGEGR